jgi:hypothetical protein
MEALEGHPDFYLVEIDVKVIREVGWGVYPDPDDDPPGHTFVSGDKSGKPGRRRRRKVAKAARWVVPPS